MAKRRIARQKDTKELLTATEVASWLRIPKSTLYKLCNDGRIPATKIGRHWRFDRAYLAKWLRARLSEGQV